MIEKIKLKEAERINSISSKINVSGFDIATFRSLHFAKKRIKEISEEYSDLQKDLFESYEIDLDIFKGGYTVGNDDKRASEISKKLVALGETEVDFDFSASRVITFEDFHSKVVSKSASITLDDIDELIRFFVIDK